MIDRNYGLAEIIQAATSPFELWANEIEDPYSISLEHPEFSALCPRSGYPDSGTIVVDYIPGPSVVELKAFKLYINSFRNRRISHECVTGEIFGKLKSEVQPVQLRVIGDFMRRGGVKTVIEFNLNPDYKFNDYRANIL